MVLRVVFLRTRGSVHTLHSLGLNSLVLERVCTALEEEKGSTWGEATLLILMQRACCRSRDRASTPRARTTTAREPDRVSLTAFVTRYSPTPSFNHVLGGTNYFTSQTHRKTIERADAQTLRMCASNPTAARHPVCKISTTAPGVTHFRVTRRPNANRHHELLSRAHVRSHPDVA